MKIFFFFLFIACLYSCGKNNTSGTHDTSVSTISPVYNNQQDQNLRRDFSQEGSLVISRYQVGIERCFPGMTNELRAHLRDENLAKARARNSWKRNANQDEQSRSRVVIHDLLELAGKDDRNYYYTDQILGFH